MKRTLADHSRGIGCCALLFLALSCRSDPETQASAGAADATDRNRTSHGEQQTPIEESAPSSGLRVNHPDAFPSYTLVAPYLSTKTYLLDQNGEVVHHWESDETPSGGAYLLEDGSLLRCADTENPRFRSNGTGGRVQIHSWDGEKTWDYLLSDDQRMQNHDFEPMPNGNVLVALWEYRTREEAIAAGYDPARASKAGLWPCVLQEIEPVPPHGGRVVWEWNAWDHLIQDLDANADNFGDVAAHPERLDINNRPLFNRLQSDDPEQRSEAQEEMRALEEQMRALGYLADEEGGDENSEDSEDDGAFDLGLGVDFLHVNSVSYEPELDLIALSCWETSEVLVIDHSTTTEQAAGHSGGRYGRGGDILYRWGNPRNYRAGSAADQQLFHQHDARWLPGPRLLVFNNDAGQGDRAADGRRRWYSTVDEIVLPFGPETGFFREGGSAFGPAEPIWTYRAEHPEDFYGSFISGAHRLENGNTFICEGPTGRLFEVTPDQRTVWEYVVPFGELSVSDWWARFGWDDMGDWGEMDGEDWGDMEMEWDDMEWEDGDWEGDGMMSTGAAFRATKIAPNHPGLRFLDQ